MQTTLLLLFVCGACEVTAAEQSGTSPATTQARFELLAEPVGKTRFAGTLHTVRNLDKLGELRNVKIIRGANADWAERNGARIAEHGLGQLLATAKPVSPNDRVVDDWQYAPWCDATFEAHGRKWSVSFFLGGLGFVTDDAGRRGALRFVAPKGESK
jgi:hypothetical protein